MVRGSASVVEGASRSAEQGPCGFDIYRRLAHFDAGPARCSRLSWPTSLASSTATSTSDIVGVATAAYLEQARESV